ncbi:MAG: SURF1 family cytochrome oxidase biogenesis protein [Microthrixaceae bacterium]
MTRTGQQIDFPDAAPPEGHVTVTGVLQVTQRRGSLGGTDAAEGRLEALSRVDLERYAEQLDNELAPAWVMLDGQDPPQPGDLPAAVELSAGEASQNFGYMFQWWIFALIGLIGYPLILRRVAHNQQAAPKDPGAGAVEPLAEPVETVERR